VQPFHLFRQHAADLKTIDAKTRTAGTTLRQGALQPDGRQDFQDGQGRPEPGRPLRMTQVKVVNEESASEPANRTS
jgi:hypothetical protein